MLTSTIQLPVPRTKATLQSKDPNLVAPVQIIELISPSSSQTYKQEYKEYYHRFRNFLRQDPQPATPSEPPTLPEITGKAPVPKVVAPAIPEKPPNLVPPTPPVATETPSQPTTELAAPETTVSQPENQPKSEQKVEFAT